MAAQKGKDLLLKINDGLVYQIVGGFKSNDITINGESVDVTTKDNAGFKELLDGAGVRSLSVSGDGVFMNDVMFGLAHGHVLAGTHPDCEITVPGLGTYTGKFAIASLQMSGSFDGEVTYNISLDSAGPIAFV